MKIAGSVLIVLGLIGLLFGGLSYQKTDNVAQIGDFKMKVTEKKHVTIPPIASGLAILVGAAMLFGSSRINRG